MTTGIVPYRNNIYQSDCGIAHRPTFDPARGKEAQRGVAYHQRLLPAHTLLKVRYVRESSYRGGATKRYRQPGQGGEADAEVRDLRAELLAAEAAHFANVQGASEMTSKGSRLRPKQLLPVGAGPIGAEDEDPHTKRRRVLEETRDIDADSDGAGSASSEEDSDDEEDETAELLRELEKIKRERAEQKAKEVRCSRHCLHTLLTEDRKRRRRQKSKKDSREILRLEIPCSTPERLT